MSNLISLLNEWSPAIKVTYEANNEQFVCIAKAYKDKEIFDCYGISVRKQDAKYKVAQELVRILKLIFPIVPIAMFNNSSPMNTG
jgi:hypothetical protein